MKRFYDIFRLATILLVALPLMWSCRHSSDPDQIDAISFGNKVANAQEAMTRAGLEDSYKDFTVWGLKTTGQSGDTYTNPQMVFGYLNDAVKNNVPGFKVVWTPNTAGTDPANTADWEYVDVLPKQHVKYWDYSATSYRFFAVAPYGNTTAKYRSVSANEAYIDLEIECDASSKTSISSTPYFSKLSFSDNNVSGLTNYFYGSTVQLEFLKPFCKVEFRFLSPLGEPLVVDSLDPLDPQAPRMTYYASGPKQGQSAGLALTDIKLRPTANNAVISTKGKITVSYPLCGTATTQSYKSEVYAGYGIAAFTEPNYEYTVLPYTGQESYVLSLTLASKTIFGTVPASYMQWKPNNKYTYLFKITELALELIDIVEVGVTEWIEEQAPDYDVYNW